LTAISIWQYRTVDEKTKADVAIVLGAGIYDGEPSPVFKERINHSLWLYENDYVDKIILTGGSLRDGGQSDSSIARLYALNNGIPAEDIYIEEQSAITEQNISYAIEVMSESSLTTAIIVSDPLHMKRAMLIAKDHGLTAYPSPTPTTRYRSPNTQLPFLARETLFYFGYLADRIFKFSVLFNM
jgi:uncharacterized SAM-binding protein YcdF (DUF218 family)